MSKIIKPKLNEKGEPVIANVKKGDWYFSNAKQTFHEWTPANPSIDKVPIHYAEEWRPKEEQWYYFYNLSSQMTDRARNDSHYDRNRIAVGNCFQTQAEAENPENILKVLDNMTKYYEEKLKGGKENGKN